VREPPALKLDGGKPRQVETDKIRLSILLLMRLHHGGAVMVFARLQRRGEKKEKKEKKREKKEKKEK
jgi:hypothetical protein